MYKIIMTLLFIFILIPQPAAAMQGDDVELRFIEAEDPIVQQQGTWTLVDNTDIASGDGYLVSSGEPNDELGLLFEGTQIEVVHLTGPDYGTFQIEIDNEIVQTIDTQSDVAQFNVRAVVNELESGFHIIRVIADRGAIAVDGFEIVGTSAISLLPDTPLTQVTIDHASRTSALIVTVGFFVPPQYQSEHHLKTEKEVEQQRDNILLIRNTILEELQSTPEYEVHLLDSTERWSLTIPYVSLQVNREAFEYLITLPYINFIRADNVDLSSINPDSDSTLVTIQAEDPIVQQQGEWTLIEDPDNVSGEGYLVSSGEPDDELGLLFEGTQIEVVYLTGKDYGTFHIEIDNEIVQTVDVSSEVSQFGVRAVVEDLDSGFHIIRVIAVDGTVAVDGFEIVGTEDISAISLLPDTPRTQALIDKSQQVGTLHIIVLFYVPPGYQSVFDFEDEASFNKQRENIILVRNTILQELSDYEVSVTSSSELFADMGLILPSEAFQHLITLPYITFIKEVAFGTPVLTDSTRIIEAEDPLVQQQGEWTLIDDTDNASGEGYLVSSDEPDDELGLLFEGTCIEVIYARQEAFGTMSIEIDNEIVQTIDTKSDVAQFNVRAVVEDLESGFHIIRIIAVEGAIAVDGFEIMPSSQPISLLERTEYHDRLLTLFDNTEKIMITLRYHVPPMFMLETRLETETERFQQRANNALVRDTLLQELAEHDIEIITNVENELNLILPSITLLVDKGAYERLLQLPYITFIRRN